MAEPSRVERTIHIASEAMGLLLVGVVTWYYIDPSAEPKQLLERAWEWVQERAQRAQGFRRTLDDVRSLPEQEDG